MTMVDDLGRCVNEFLVRAEAERPVLVLSGSRRGGKTTALKELQKGLARNGLPHAFHDYADLHADTPQLLSALMFELNRSSAYGRLPFPRLIVGLIVMPLELGDDDPDEARKKVRIKIEEYRKVPALRKFLEDLSADLIKLLPLMQDKDLPGLVGTLTQGLLITGALKLPSTRKLILGPAMDWWTLDKLVRLARLYKASRVADGEKSAGGNQKQVGQLLWEAFLADLDAGFTGRGKDSSWNLNCVVLVDNADTPAGVAFVTELDEALKIRRDSNTPAPPLTVIATSREKIVRRALPPLVNPVPLRDASMADYKRRTREERTTRKGWYAVLLPGLTEIETANMVDKTVDKDGPIRNKQRQASGESFAPIIFQFTAGHPEATSVIVQQLSGSDEPANLETVLTKTPDPPQGRFPNAPSVEKWLTQSLTEGLSSEAEGLGSKAVSDLMICSAARDLADATLLEEDSHMLSGQHAASSPLFAPELWVESTGGENAEPGPTVMLPVLRRLMLRSLAKATGATDGSDKWTDVFKWLKDKSYEEGRVSEQAQKQKQMYYALALGDTELASKHLSDRLNFELTQNGAIDWLNDWYAVTEAPRRGPASGIDSITNLVAWVHESKDEGKEQLKLVAELVAARWLLANSLQASHQRKLRQEVTILLDRLAGFAGAGREVFRNRAEEYQRSAEK